jgi:hypothetical protein
LSWKIESINVAATLPNVPHMDNIINTIVIVATNVTFVLEYDVTMLLVSCLIYQEFQRYILLSNPSRTVRIYSGENYRGKIDKVQNKNKKHKNNIEFEFYSKEM